MPDGVDPERVSASKGSHDIPEHIIEAGASMLLWLSDEHIDVVPGQPARLRVNVRNISAVVQTFSLHALGPGAQWTAILPGQISLFPGEEGSASIVVRAQKSPTLPAGHYVIGIMARSEVDHSDSVVGEFDVSVRPYHQFKAALSRPTVDMRRSATMFLQITNDGNSPVTYQIQATDPEGRLVARLSHSTVLLPPGDPTWIKVQIKAPMHLLGSPLTHGLIVTTTGARDETTGSDLSDVQPSIQRSTIIQRPLFHFRLGFFGRMALLLLLLGLVATFLIPRLINAFLPRPVTGAPLVPAGFVAGLDPDQQVLLTWNPASGATGYAIYAVGVAGDPVPTPSPSSATVTATATATVTVTPSSSPAETGPTMPASVVGLAPPTDAPDGVATEATVLRRAAQAAKRSATPTSVSLPAIPASPTGSDSVNSAAGQLATLPVPLCDDCSHVADVPGGTTRYVVTNAPPGITACYRIVAVAGSAQSMFSPQACVSTPGVPSGGGAVGPSGTESGAGGGTGSQVPTDGSATNGTGSDASPGGPSGSTGTPGSQTPGKETPGKETFPASPSPKPPSPSASSTGSPSATATVTALPPCPPLNPKATALSSTAVVAVWSVISSAAADSGCNPKAKATSFQIDQQIGTGWTTLSGAPTGQDTAYQITGLAGSIQYCFRMRTVSGALVSSNTAAFCATTLPSTASPSTSSGSASPTPSSSASASASASVSATTTSAKTMRSLVRSGRTPVTADDVLSLQTAVKTAEDQARQARQAADEAGLQAIALAQQAQRQKQVADEAEARLGSLANAMYRQGEVSTLVEAVLFLGSPRSTALTVAPAYVTSGGADAMALVREQRAAKTAADQAATMAADAARGAEVLEGLARQQLAGLQGVLREAVRAQTLAGTQTIVGSDGCPIAAPGSTLRGGSEELGVAELCRRSVAQAATPQAALAVKYALSQLGAPYACGGVGRLDPFRFDCSSFVARAFADGAGIGLTRNGWAPSTRNMVPWDGIALDRHYALLPEEQLAPGDLVLYDTGGATYRHVVMVLADGYMVHTNACGDVLHVDRFWGTAQPSKGRFLVARRVLVDPTYTLAPGDPATGDIATDSGSEGTADPLVGDSPS